MEYRLRHYKGVRKYQMKQEPAWHRMDHLANTPGYIIRINREMSKHSAPNLLLFPSQADSIKSDRNSKPRVIQTISDTDPSKKLCIYFRDPLRSDVYQKIEYFVREMIAASTEEERDQIFKTYKNTLHLPFNFDYTLYAWQSSVDCAFYNLGSPVYFNPTPDIPPARTDLSSEFFDDMNRYAVQISTPDVLDREVKLIHLKTCQSELDYTVLPIRRHYSDGTLFFLNLSSIPPKISLKDGICRALFVDSSEDLTPIDSERIEFLSKVLKEHDRSGLAGMRLFLHMNSRAIPNLFDRNTESLIMASWKARHRTDCSLPSEFDFTSHTEFDIEDEEYDDNVETLDFFTMRSADIDRSYETVESEDFFDLDSESDNDRSNTSGSTTPN